MGAAPRVAWRWGVAGVLHIASVAALAAPEFKVGLGNVLSLFMAATFLLAWRGAIFAQTRNVLWACVLLSLLLPLLLPVTDSSPSLSAHAVLALLVYALSAVACLYCLDLHYGEKKLRHNPSELDSTFSLLKVERRCFLYIMLAFVLLTLTLISGFATAYARDEPLWTLTHKNLFGVLTWLVFLVLLLGRAAWGWRGRIAVRWFASGFVFLVLSYIGSQFVTQVILGR